jgi:S1-C subfamily serine protease
VKPAGVLVGLALVVAGCAGSLAGGGRSEVIRRILPSTVQLRAEREGGARRAASGIVLASDATAKRAWILTTQHFLEPPIRQEVYVSAPGRRTRVSATVAAVDRETDLAVIEVTGLDLPAVKLKEAARLGDEVWVVAFPWGRRMTVVSGVVSQIAGEEGEVTLEGPVRMVDASVSYGSSGGGVFDAVAGELVGVVEGYRRARVAIPESPERAFEVPVPGETTVIPSSVIIRFLENSGLGDLLHK